MCRRSFKPNDANKLITRDPDDRSGTPLLSNSQSPHSNIMSTLQCPGVIWYKFKPGATYKDICFCLSVILWDFTSFYVFVPTVQLLYCFFLIFTWMNWCFSQSCLCASASGHLHVLVTVVVVYCFERTWFLTSCFWAKNSGAEQDRVEVPNQYCRQHWLIYYLWVLHTPSLSLSALSLSRL